MRTSLVHLGLLALLIVAPPGSAEEADFDALARSQDAAVAEKGQAAVLAEARKAFKADPTFVNRLLLAAKSNSVTSIQQSQCRRIGALSDLFSSQNQTVTHIRRKSSPRPNDLF